MTNFEKHLIKSGFRGIEIKTSNNHCYICPAFKMCQCSNTQSCIEAFMEWATATEEITDGKQRLASATKKAVTL